MSGAALRMCRVAVIASVLAGPLRAQTADAKGQSAPPAIKWGKWAAAALAAGFTALGIHQHNSGDAAYTALINYCTQAGPCPLASDGHYANAQAEALYQRVVRDDRSARAWLIGGEIAAVGSAVLFVLELGRDKGPPNIPYSGLLVEPGFRATKLGFRLPIGGPARRER
jgi:hypothetical protein